MDNTNIFHFNHTLFYVFMSSFEPSRPTEVAEPVRKTAKDLSNEAEYAKILGELKNHKRLTKHMAIRLFTRTCMVSPLEEFVDGRCSVWYLDYWVGVGGSRKII